MSLLQQLHQEGKTIVMVTHEEDIARHADRIIRFKDGHVILDEPVRSPVKAQSVLASLPGEVEA